MALPDSFLQLLPHARARDGDLAVRDPAPGRPQPALPHRRRASSLLPARLCPLLMLTFVLLVAGSAALLALLALAFRWYSATDVIVQTAAVLWIGLAVLAMQQGFGRDSRYHRLILSAAALLLLISLPTAFGIIDAG